MNQIKMYEPNYTIVVYKNTIHTSTEWGKDNLGPNDSQASPSVTF